jgi:quinol monooxygenase YgiN
MVENILIEQARFDIREGKLEEVKAAMKKAVELIKAKEPRIIFYNVYINEDGMQLTVLQAHPDSASVEFHGEVTEPIFTKMAKECITLVRFDIYGTPSQSLLDMLQHPVITRGVTAAAHELSAGFSRF